MFNELKPRNVTRVALFYVIVAWLLVQVAETVLPLLDVPDGVLRGLVILLVLGFVPVRQWVLSFPYPLRFHLTGSPIRLVVKYASASISARQHVAASSARRRSRSAARRHCRQRLLLETTP